MQRKGFFAHLGIENFDILHCGSDVLGGFCLTEESDHLWLHLLLIKPNVQQRGGGKAMQYIQAKASSVGKPLQFCTMKVNPATDFYRYLGYRQYKEDEACIYFEENS